MTSITIYDGNNTIGGTKIFVEQNDKGVILDFGKNFAKESKYFQEFLTSRTARGIYDDIQFGLIPRLNIYRKELIPVDLDVSGFESLNIEAILISHAHMDHFGNIGLLKKEYPILGSPKTLGLIKAMEDSSKLSAGSEVVYHRARKSSKKGRVLKSSGNDYKLRGLIFTKSISDQFESFFRENLRLKALQTGIKAIEGEEFQTLNDEPSQFKINAYNVDHSIYGATAYLLEGDTTIAYSGDFRLHGKLANESKKFISAARDASTLIIEGTRVSREEENSEESEETICQECLNVIEDAKGLVVANFAGRNIERFETFKEIAEKTGRKMIVPAKTAYLLKALDLADKGRRANEVKVFYQLSSSNNTWEENFISDDFDYVDYEEIKVAQESYLIYLSFYEIKHLLDLKLDGGTYIYSSSEAFTEEAEFDFIRFNNWLEYFNFNVHGLEINMDHGKPIPVFNKKFHASGHVSAKELIETIDTIDPDTIIPVHTEHPEWFTDNFGSKVKILNGGEKHSL